MRRIYITKSVRNLAKHYAANLFKDKNANFQLPSSRLDKLIQSFSYQKDMKYAIYLKNIKNKYNYINALSPQYYDAYAKKYFGNLSDAELVSIKVVGDEKKSFYEWVVWAMRYDEVRASSFIPYVKKLGIKTCVYCNAQFAVTTEEGRNHKARALYELDHFMPKSKYPFLCTSFFNLQPSCSCCNKAKSNDTNYKWFNLYTTDYNRLNPFVFSIIGSTDVRYLLHGNKNLIQVELKNRPFANFDDKEILKSELEKLHINEIYQEHNDVVEELLWKAKIYTPDYIEVLKKQYGNDFFEKDHIDINRFILGNYADEQDLHRRPLAKFVQDIAKQLGLIG